VAKTYRVSAGTRVVNAAFRGLTRLGLGKSYRHLLAVRGRRTGRLYTTPVDVMEVDGARWLVAGYGPSQWARNVRASGEVTLSRGGRSGRYRVVEAQSGEAVPVLRRYIAEVPVTRPYFDAAADSPDDALAAEMARHPVFRLIPAEPPT
jgi:deazaflavin-dependent oxidoreductase (nitroreductase family)